MPPALLRPGLNQHFAAGFTDINAGPAGATREFKLASAEDQRMAKPMIIRAKDHAKQMV